MDKLRQMAAAFIFRDDLVLMMKRADTREFAPGLWAPVGGHMESPELNDPGAASLREVFEETGITGAGLSDFRLKYLILRQKDEEIRMQYVYFASTRTSDLQQTEEGELHWIERSRILDLELALTSRITLEHYFKVGFQTDGIFVGTIRGAGEQPAVNWAQLY
jgi:8-oxo-dGTP diphosphatase